MVLTYSLLAIPYSLFPMRALPIASTYGPMRNCPSWELPFAFLLFQHIAASDALLAERATSHL